MGHRMISLGACIALMVVACSGESTPTSPTIPTTMSPATTTSAPDTTAPNPTSTPSTVATTTSTSTTDASTSTIAGPSGTFTPALPFVAPEPTSDGGGSGCRPGTTDLPDGVWFGIVSSPAASSFQFDLACFTACPSGGEGHQIVNDSNRKRSLVVHPDAVVLFESDDLPDSEDWQAPFAEATGWEGALEGYAWAYINDGVVTHVVLPFDVSGCALDVVRVDWDVELPSAGAIAFNDLGLAAALTYPGTGTHFYWRNDGWQTGVDLSGTVHTGWEGTMLPAEGATVGAGDIIQRWDGSTWSTESLGFIGDDVTVIGVSGDRVLLTGTEGTDAVVHVAERTGNGWKVDTIRLGTTDTWMTWAGAISEDTFAVSDTGIDTRHEGTVLVFDRTGSSWTRTATLVDRWSTGNWGSSLDLDGERLVVGADGATPGPGTPGGVYLFTRRGTSWSSEVIGEQGEGFGFATRIDGDTIVTSASHGDPSSTFWVFSHTDAGWLGTPIRFADEGHDHDGDWVSALDVHHDEVAVSTIDSLRIGKLVRSR